jgi:hypothetical protein
MRPEASLFMTESNEFVCVLSDYRLHKVLCSKEVGPDSAVRKKAAAHRRQPMHVGEIMGW